MLLVAHYQQSWWLVIKRYALCAFPYLLQQVRKLPSSNGRFVRVFRTSGGDRPDRCAAPAGRGLADRLGRCGRLRRVRPAHLVSPGLAVVADPAARGVHRCTSRLTAARSRARIPVPLAILEHRVRLSVAVAVAALQPLPPL